MVGPRDIKFFLDLARRKTAESRRTLFESVADLFIAQNGHLSERERAEVTAILHDLINDVEKHVRATLADRLKERADVPPELARILANDEIDIARPILIRSPVLRDPDLVEIIRLRGQEYRLAITLRQSVSEQVSDAIIETHDPDVIRSLLQNRDARLSESAMEYLVAEAERVDRLQTPLVRRHDLPPDLGMRMYWWVAAALRHHIVHNFALDALTELAVDELIEETSRAAAGTDAALRSIAGTAYELMDRLAKSQGLTPDLLTQLLRNGRVPAVVAGFALACGLDQRLARRILLSRDPESMAILCRHIGFNRNEFGNLFLLMNTANHHLSTGRPAELLPVLKFFDELTGEIAEAVVRYWRLRPGFADAVENLEVT